MLRFLTGVLGSPRPQTGQGATTRRRFQPALEPLETRAVPTATIVQDIFPGDGSSDPRELVDIARIQDRPGHFVRGALFFSADDGILGRELWVRRRNGVVERVKDINTGTAGSDPQHLTEVDGILFFSADDGLLGRELWRSDGTPEGTFMVRDINPGSASSDPTELIKFKHPVTGNKLLYFAADDGINGRELWRSNGKREGTRIVRDINPGVGDSSPTYLTVVKAPGRAPILFFRADDFAHGPELWRTTGTTGGTRLIEDIRPGPLGSNPFNLTKVGGRLFFGADDGLLGAELWRATDAIGSARLVEDINQGAASSLIESPTTLMTEFGTPSGVRLLFAADDGFRGRELWTSDGSAARTEIVEDINPGPNSSNPSMQDHPLPERRALIIRRPGGRKLLLFGADDGFLGGELWRTNGKADATKLVRDINPGPDDGLISNLLIGIVNPTKTRIYFAANDGDLVHHNELWRSNGTNAGTRFDTDINPGPAPSDPSDFEISARTLFFAAEGLLGRELWQLANP